MQTRVSAWSACRRTCSPSWSGRSPRRRRPGVDVISLGIGDPDTPTPDAVVDALAARGAPTRARTSTRPTAAGPSSARRSRASTSAASACELDPETEIMPALGAKECVFNLNLAFLDPGDVALAADPGYPVYTGGPLLARRRGGADAAAARARLRARPRRDRAEDRRARAAACSSTTRTTRPARWCPTGCSSAAVEFAREHDVLVVHDASYTETTFDGYVGAELPRDAGREGRRRRGLLALEGLEHDRLAHGGDGRATPRPSRPTGS